MTPKAHQSGQGGEEMTLAQAFEVFGPARVQGRLGGGGESTENEKLRKLLQTISDTMLARNTLQIKAECPT